MTYKSSCYWQYLKYLLLHKWFVFVTGRWISVPFWRLVIHDLSKFTPVEFLNYARFKYGVKSIDEWVKAWLHHLQHNSHHPEHWILSWLGDPDYYREIGQDIARFVVCLPMPELDVREMVADWIASSKQFTGSYNIDNWLNGNGPDMHFHQETIVILDQVMHEIGYVSTDCWSWEPSEVRFGSLGNKRMPE